MPAREGAVKPDLIVVDPPRAGLHPRVLARCAELRPRRIVYVSCNPTTLAGDLKRERRFASASTGVHHVRAG